MWCWWPVAERAACARASASSDGETNARISTVISTIITIPPMYSAIVNCQPISTHSTSPSSQTMFVEASWNASAPAAEAPFSNSDFAIATAA